MKNGSADVVVRLFREAANLNVPGIAFAGLSEGAHAGDALWVYQPIVGQAVDSTMRGYLQALAPDPMLDPLTVIAAPGPNI
jgi:hypothetical protein